MTLQGMIEDFADKWGPRHHYRAPQLILFREFIGDLRALLEAYGKAALEHESLPDTEHQHGDPV